jgi:hypothetical protein
MTRGPLPPEGTAEVRSGVVPLDRWLADVLVLEPVAQLLG